MKKLCNKIAEHKGTLLNIKEMSTNLKMIFSLLDIYFLIAFTLTMIKESKTTRTLTKENSHHNSKTFTLKKGGLLKSLLLKELLEAYTHLLTLFLLKNGKIKSRHLQNEDTEKILFLLIIQIKS